MSKGLPPPILGDAFCLDLTLYNVLTCMTLVGNMSTGWSQKLRAKQEKNRYPMGIL